MYIKCVIDNKGGGQCNIYIYNLPVTCIIYIEASLSVGKISTTAWETLCKAILVLGFNYSLSNVDKTRTKYVDPDLKYKKKISIIIIFHKFIQIIF